MPTYYHVSSEKFDRLMPKYSQKFKQYGIYLAPSLKSILESWGRYILEKKRLRWRTAREKHLQTRNKSEDHLARDINEPEGYETLYLYKIQVPHAIEKPAHQTHELKKNEALQKNFLEAYGAWGWDEELFIPEEDVSKLHIMNCKKITRIEFEKWFKKYDEQRIEKSFRKKSSDLQIR